MVMKAKENDVVLTDLVKLNGIVAVLALDREHVILLKELLSWRRAMHSRELMHSLLLLLI
jgi:hypothetical protein